MDSQNPVISSSTRSTSSCPSTIFSNSVTIPNNKNKIRNTMNSIIKNI